MTDEPRSTPAERTWAALAAGLGLAAWAATVWAVLSRFVESQCRVEMWPSLAAWAVGLTLVALAETRRSWRQALLIGVLVVGWMLPLILDSVSRWRPDAFQGGAAFVQALAVQALPLLLLTFWFQLSAEGAADPFLKRLPGLHARLAAVGVLALLAPTVLHLCADGQRGEEGLFGWMASAPEEPWKAWVWSAWKLVGRALYAACLLFPLFVLARFARYFWRLRDEDGGTTVKGATKE